MNKIILSIIIASLVSVTACSPAYKGQTWYNTCKLNANATFIDDETGERVKCTDKLTIRR